MNNTLRKQCVISIENDYENHLSHDDKCSVLFRRFLIYSWSKRKTWNIIFHVFAKESVYIGLIGFLYIGIRVIQPLILRFILQKINEENIISKDLIKCFVWSIFLFLCFVIQAIVYQQLFFRSSQLGKRASNSLTQILYQHLLSIDVALIQQMSQAQSMNLLINDVKKFEEFYFYGHFLWIGPIEALITFVLLVNMIGLYATCFGFAVLVLLIPIQIFFSRKFSEYCQVTLSFTDKRIDAFIQLLNGFMFIKMSNCEKLVEDDINLLRENEEKSIAKSNVLRSINLSLYFASIILVSFVTFGTLWIFGYQLKLIDVAITLIYLCQIRLTLVTLMANGIERLSEMMVASNRIDNFMKLNRYQPVKRQLFNNISILEMIDASFSWANSSREILSSVNLKIKQGEFIGICGPVGSGKSSLFYAILGEMKRTRGSFFVNGRVSYCSQSPWIIPDTIRANIILGQEFNETRYRTVLEATCLNFDLQNFGRDGDLTIVGEKGINLSGGQRTRIALARAIYFDAEIYLFDDPLAAVDQQIAKQIFDRCVGQQSLLKEKTRLLITHQIPFLIESNRNIQVKNGQCQFIDIFPHIEKLDNDPQFNRSQEIQNEQINNDQIAFNQKLFVYDEETLQNSHNWLLLLKLFRKSSNCFRLLVFVLFMIIGQILFDVTNVFLFFWTSKTYEQQRKETFYFYIYLALSLSTFVFAFFRTFFWFDMMFRASKYLHKSILNGIVYTSMQFIENNPIGNILNRVARDQNIVDETIPISFFDSLQELFIVINSIIIISIINPFILLFFIPLSIVTVYLTYSYLKINRQLKQIECSTRHPIYTLYSSTFDGLMTIRTFKLKETFSETFMNHVDVHTSADIRTLRCIYALGLKLDLIVSIFVFLILIVFILLRHKFNSLLISISLICCFSLPNRLQWSIRQLLSTDNDMIHLKRIYDYTKLSKEEDVSEAEEIRNIPNDWPKHGNIQFRNYSQRYRSDREISLENINIHIKQKEKIGIIGRTGAGKSSLFQAIFRLTDRSQFNGEILIDNIDISRIKLNRLRSCLTIIPQTPVLFRKTLRSNLDPFNIYTDEQISAAIETLQLKEVYRRIAESDTSTLSIGERQLICLTRAFLRRSKILLIDEATAHIDCETIKLIQQIIVDHFHDSTILTIAHRLTTIKNSDRILVLDKGKVVRFDEPNQIF